MSRRRAAKKRELNPDYRYGSVNIAKFINIIMNSGKRTLAESIVYKAVDKAFVGVEEENESAFFSKILMNVGPTSDVRPRRLGGATYQIPMEITNERSRVLGMRFLKKYSLMRKEKTMWERLAGELRDAYNGVGSSVKAREEKHKLAEANRAFATFRW